MITIYIIQENQATTYSYKPKVLTHTKFPTTSTISDNQSKQNKNNNNYQIEL